jgi:uncharacterized protein
MKTKKETVEKFLNAGRIAIAGVSRNQKKFGFMVYNELKKKGYNIVPVNPHLSELDGAKCYSSVDDIPGELNAVLTVIPPEQTLNLLNNITRKDIRSVWMQSGSESKEAMEFCRNSGIESIAGECILMYAKPEGFHKVHRFINKIFGKLPA